MGWQCSEILSVWQLLLEQRSPPTLVLLDQTPNTNGASCPSKVQVSPHPNPATPWVPHLGSVLCTKGWLLVQLPMDPRASSWKRKCVLEGGGLRAPPA